MKSVVIVGVGALGSHLVMFLRNIKVNLIVVDFDRIEITNLMSQFHVKTNVGKNKASSLHQAMNFLFGVKLATSIGNRLTADNVKTLLGDADLVIDAVDNGATRRLIQGFVRKVSIPCLHGALALDGSYGRVAWDETFVVDDEDAAGVATCEDGAHLPFIGIVSSHLARAAQEFLATGRKIGFEIHSAGAVRT